MNKDQFKIIKPSERFTSYIEEFWFVRMHNTGGGMQRIIPNVNILISFNRDVSYSTISGFSKYYTEISYSDSIDFVTVVFKPLGAFVFLGTPLNIFRDQHLLIGDVEDENLSDLEDRIFNSKSDFECVSIIEFFLEKKWNKYKKIHHNRLEYTLNQIQKGESSLSSISRNACLCSKHFNRIFNEYVGINPKEYIKIVRFQQVLHDLQLERRRLDNLAFEHNYFDKSHLIKEFKAYTGSTIKEYNQSKEPYSKYHSLFRSTFIDVRNNNQDKI